MPTRKAGRTHARREEEFAERSYRKTTKAKRGKKANRRNRGAITAICIAVIAVVIAITAGCVHFLNIGQNEPILENVSVAGVDVGGLTQTEAISLVKAATTTYASQSMTVKVLDSQVQISPETANITLNVKAAVKAAYKYGRSGPSSQQKAEQENAMNNGYAVDVTPYLQLNSDAVKAALEELGADYSSTLSQSTYEVTGTVPDQTLVINLGVPEYGLDLNALYEKVLAAYSSNTFTVEGECGMIQPDPIDLEAILMEHYVAPVDATLDPETYEVTEGVDGYGFDLEGAKKKLEQAPYGTKVEIPFTAIPPEVTGKDLSKVLYRDKLATYTATKESDENRATNLRLACESINGMILYPGDVFSYNNALGERTTARGYKPGPSYSGNETVETVGGGICQVSSALYYCAMVADLEILARENHGFATSYMPLGMDASVSWGSLDFRFRNNTEYPIRIEASASGGEITVTLVGTDEKDYYVVMEYEVLATYNYNTTYKTMTANNPQGYRNGDYITEPYTGYDIETYRCKYNKESEALISKDLEAVSKYRKRDGVICSIEGSSNQKPDQQPSQGIGNGGVTDSGELPPELP